jgi:hypothetical protein
VAAAAILLDGHGPQDAPAEVATAAGSLVRHIDDADRSVRVAAIEAADVRWPELREAVLEAASSNDDAVAVAALGRKLELREDRRPALDRLIALARQPGEVGDRAKQLLAEAGDPRVLPLLERDAAAASATDRANAALRLVLLGKVKPAMLMLADPNAQVRAITACALLRDGQ